MWLPLGGRTVRAENGPGSASALEYFISCKQMRGSTTFRQSKKQLKMEEREE